MTAKCLFTKPMGASTADQISDAYPMPTKSAETEGDYETVAASQTDQVMGGTGAVGDYLAKITIVPASTSPGAVTIKDGSGSAITVFAGGSSSVADLKAFTIFPGLTSAAGAWKVTTGANVSVVVAGSFT